jgi:hypothetical protein
MERVIHRTRTRTSETPRSRRRNDGRSAASIQNGDIYLSLARGDTVNTPNEEMPMNSFTDDPRISWFLDDEKVELAAEMWRRGYEEAQEDISNQHREAREQAMAELEHKLRCLRASL